MKGFSIYFFSYFQNNGEDGLHLAQSSDGLDWMALNGNRSVLTPEVGDARLMRDPCIYPGPDGRFHMVWTVGWGERGIGYAHSDDLVNWSKQIFIPVMAHEPEARNCWAPEMIYDPDNVVFVIFWASTIPGRYPDTDDQSSHGRPGEGRNHRMYCTTTSDFESFTETRLFYDPGFNVIDACVVHESDRFVMFLKDETNKPFVPQKNIKIAFSDRATGPYSETSSPITGDYWCEGPSAIQIDGTWHVYFDRYRDSIYGLLTSHDLETWIDRTASLHLPGGTKHGSIFRAPGSLLSGWNRTKGTA